MLPIPSNTPAELRALPQWVCWRYEDRNGKRTNAPINAKSNRRPSYAKSNDPATWTDFDAARSACGLHPELAGVGFCFAPDDGLTGIDLDHVFNPDTGELKPEAAEILERFQGTYAEISPSGNGLRLFCYGQPRRSGKNAGKLKWVEVYSHPSSRYLTRHRQPLGRQRRRRDRTAGSPELAARPIHGVRWPPLWTPRANPPPIRSTRTMPSCSPRPGTPRTARKSSG